MTVFIITLGFAGDYLWQNTDENLDVFVEIKTIIFKKQNSSALWWQILFCEHRRKMRSDELIEKHQKNTIYVKFNLCFSINCQKQRFFNIVF